MEKKTEINGIYKVTEGILINKDNTSLQAYKKRKKQANKLKTLEDDLLSIKGDITEIKELLKGLVR